MDPQLEQRAQIDQEDSEMRQKTAFQLWLLKFVSIQAQKRNSRYRQHTRQLH